MEKVSNKVAYGSLMKAFTNQLLRDYFKARKVKALLEGDIDNRRFVAEHTIYECEHIFQQRIWDICVVMYPPASFINRKWLVETGDRLVEKMFAGMDEDRRKRLAKRLSVEIAQK